ncbi:NAD(P)-binding protein [Mariniblastus sp.]|nr:NAD(P)-binding protein [Mariniblastus sp.]
MNRIAIIGSGIAGLTFAWLAEQAGLEVTVFESQASLGMDAHSLDVSTAEGITDQLNSVRVDVPPRMFNQEDWPLLSALYDSLGVESQEVDASKSFSTPDRSGWLKLGGQYRGGFSAASLLSSKVRGVATETARMQASVTSDAIERMPIELTLGQYLKQESYRDDFVFDFLFPGLSATVLTCSYNSLENYPAKVALHSLLNQVDRSPLRRTTNGTADVVARLSESLNDVRLSTPVASINQSSDSVRVICADATECQFDRLVVATQANSAARLLDDAPSLHSAQEILRKFEYEDVPVVVHRDDSLMPKKQSDWRCFNFESADDRSDAMCTIWLNRFYPEWPETENVFQTIRSLRMPAKEKTIATSAMQRPTVSQQSLNAVRDLQSSQTSVHRVTFIGSYAAATVPLLESGVASAYEAARKMGIESAS